MRVRAVPITLAALLLLASRRAGGPGTGRPARADVDRPTRRRGARAARHDGRRRDRPRPRARQRAPGLREPHRLGAGGHVPLPPAPVRLRLRLRRVGRPRARAGRDPREAAGPRDLPRAHDAAHRPRPAAAGRGGRGRRTGVAALRRRRVLRARVADPRLGDEARRAAVPAGGAARLGPRRVPARAAAARGRRAGRRAPRRPRAARRRGRARRPRRAAARHARRRCSPSTAATCGSIATWSCASRPRDGAPSLRLSAFRNPKGTLPDGLALAPWERPSEIPPETDGFFLLELLPPSAPLAALVRPGPRPRVPRDRVRHLALAPLVGPRDRLRAARPRARLAHAEGSLRARRLRQPAGAALAGGAGDAGAPRAGARRRCASGRSRRAATSRRPLAEARARRRRRTGASCCSRDGPRQATLGGARRGTRARAALHVADRRGDARVVRDRVVAAARAGRLRNRDRALLPPARWARSSRSRQPAARRRRSRVQGGEPKLRDVYPVLAQPPSPGSLSGWIGRYAVAAAVAALGARLAAAPRRPRGARRAAAR